jgi:hypothetical protein
MAVPKGTRIGGRQKGTPNKVTVEKTAEIAASGLTPLDYMLQILRDETLDTGPRFEAAKAAAPYVHPRLANVDANLSGDVGLTIEIVRFGQNPAS